MRNDSSILSTAVDEKVLIARFLRSNNHDETLKSFIREAKLPEDVGLTEKNDLTLERLLQEKKAFDLSIEFERLGTDDSNGWSKPAPRVPSILSTPSASNPLCLKHVVHSLMGDSFGLWSTTADRRVNITNLSTRTTVGVSCQYEAPVLSIACYTRFVVYGDMAGNVTIASADDHTIFDRRRDHTKYVVRIAIKEYSGGTWIATAGWDATVFVYMAPVSLTPHLGSPVAKIQLQSNPESMLFVEHPTHVVPMLLMSRRDSTFLHYYDISTVVPDGDRDPNAAPQELKLTGRQNLAPYALSWVSFTPSDIAVCPTDDSLVAVATSSTPHMKVMIVKLLGPVLETESMSGSHAQRDINDTISTRDAAADTRFALGRAEIVRQDREEAAIRISCNTMAPQTNFSTPIVVWRPDGSGVWVGGDDGVIRGINASSGKVETRLEGHEAGSKIRCLWAGAVPLDANGKKQKELLVSGAFDQKLILWE